ncbi:MAG: type VI secretion system protein TssA, partial [Alphaproteobacteria bacterium]|nr:type VI secretion system protein TssA [Alphaproteobacteria bacterium]
RGLAGLIADATEARAAWQEFQDQIDARFGYDAPPTRRVAEVLDRLVEVAQRLGGEADAPALEGAAEAAPESADAPVATAGGGFALPAGGPAGREQALKMLEQIAAFFQRTEPHSFLAYTLTDAARRGRMTLPELLSEVLADDGARTAMLTALGIRPGTMDENG